MQPTARHKYGAWVQHFTYAVLITFVKGPHFGVAVHNRGRLLWQVQLICVSVHGSNKGAIVLATKRRKQNLVIRHRLNGVLPAGEVYVLDRLLE